jgi:flagellar protein FliO/FliZ
LKALSGRAGSGECRTKKVFMEFIDVLRYFGALLLVLALVGGAGLVARRFGVPGITRAAADKRLAIVETLMIGPRQRLFIVRRDDVEHLVLSGPEGATVIESKIAARDIAP